jgi:hypothetical protein
VLEGSRSGMPNRAAAFDERFASALPFGQRVRIGVAAFDRKASAAP